ncbi:MAG: hypothetical protein HY645_13030 [Acidobacteria bacterium]|nr:hypothetical protein [Acidobacteriota bacterium]
MRKVRAILFFSALTLAFGIHAMAETGSKLTPGTDTVSFLHATGTPKQTAVFAAFMARLPGATAIDTAISVSNMLAVPPAVAPTPVAGGANDNFELIRARGDRQGTIEFYLFDADGTLIVFETAAGSPGTGLRADGTLAPGETYTVLLSDILTRATGSATRSFAGYAWIVANCDGVAGTYTVTIFATGFTQAFHMEPAVGSGGFIGGIPVVVP